jgi:hypothetical protein
MTATKAVNGVKLGRPTDLYGPLWRLAVKIRAAWLRLAEDSVRIR